jgi:hypothetical protein
MKQAVMIGTVTCAIAMVLCASTHLSGRPQGNLAVNSSSEKERLQSDSKPEWALVIVGIATLLAVGWQAIVMSAQKRVMKAQVRVTKAQVRVMKWQVRSSARQNRIQNLLIRLQHEHEWVIQKNREREQLLKLARDLHLAVGCLREESSDVDHLHWERVQDIVHELYARLNILDPAVFSSSYDGWFFNLEGYVDAILKAVIDDAPSTETPNVSTRKALKEADDHYKPTSIFLDLETAIRMEFFDFKNKWDAALPT